MKPLTVLEVEPAGRALPTRMMIDPRGWERDVTHLGKTAYKIGDQAIMHPSTFWPQFGKNLVNADEWKHDPAKALGELVPGLVLAAATAGAGLGAAGAARAATALAGEAEEFELMAAMTSDEDLASGAMAGARIQLGKEALKSAQEDMWLGRQAALRHTEAAIATAGFAQAAEGASTHALDGGAAGVVLEKGMAWGLKPGEVPVRPATVMVVRPATVIIARVFIPVP